MTPKPLFEEGFSFYFFSNENNEPAHVHVAKGEGNAKWWLEPEVKENYSYGFKPNQRRRIRKLIEEHRGKLLEAWYEHFKKER